jgi:protein-disulfide isomerase
MHDVLFENVSNLGPAALRGFAQGLGLDLAKYDACVVDPAQVAAVKADQADGAAVGVEGTPAYFVNGVNLSGAQPEAAFIDLVEQALAEKAR